MNQDMVRKQKKYRRTWISFAVILFLLLLVFFSAICVSTFFPTLYFFTPFAAFFGGVAAFFLVYCLSWKQGLSPLRIILTGVAVDALFTGLSSIFSTMTGGQRTGVASIVEANITQKTWSDVGTLFPYVLAGLFLAILFVGECSGDHERSWWSVLYSSASEVEKIWKLMRWK